MPLRADRLIPIPMEDPLVHTIDNPICADPTCPDKTYDDLLAEFARQVAPLCRMVCSPLRRLCASCRDGNSSAGLTPQE